MKPKDKYRHLRQNPVHDFFKVFGFVLVASICALFLLNIFSSALIGQIPIEVEMKIFNNNEKSFWSSKDEVEVEELTELMEQLVEVQDKETYPFTIRLSCSSTPNAYAAPGGKIVITKGLLKTLKSENGLLFVIGHELGHFYHRHHLKGFGKSLILVTVLTSVGVSGEAKALSDMLSMGSDFVGLSFSRKQEIDSDAYGLKLMRKSVGTTSGAHEVFAKMAEKNKNSVDWMSTHPQSEKRVAEILKTNNPDPSAELKPIPESILKACGDLKRSRS